MSREANDVKLDVSPTFRRAIELWCRMYLWQADPLLRITTWLVRKSTIIRKFAHCLTVLNNLINRFSLYLSIHIYFHRLYLVPLIYSNFFFCEHFWSICTMYYDFLQADLFQFAFCVLYLSLSLSLSFFYYYLLLLICLSTHVSQCLHFV